MTFLICSCIVLLLAFIHMGLVSYKWHGIAQERLKEIELLKATLAAKDKEFIAFARSYDGPGVIVPDPIQGFGLIPGRVDNRITLNMQGGRTFEFEVMSVEGGPITGNHTFNRLETDEQLPIPKDVKPQGFEVDGGGRFDEL